MKHLFTIMLTLLTGFSMGYAQQGETNPDQLRVLIIGAHPDDAEAAGGLAARYTAAGHLVKLMSLTNGDAGHHEMGGWPLALRRREECRRSADVIGAESQVLDNHDGELEPSWQLRKQLIQIIREFAPDLIITHRQYDYHPDHRYTGQLVVDAYTELSVAGNAGLTPYLKKFPILMYISDHFTKPIPFKPEVVIDIGSTIDQKVTMYHQHTSQMYEWIPYIQGRIDQVPETDAARKAWLAQSIKGDAEETANHYRETLVKLYGKKKGNAVKYAEAFEISEYTLHLEQGKLEMIVPFLKGEAGR